MSTQLWSTGSLGVHSPTALLGAVFFYNGLSFMLHGVAEHRVLKISHLLLHSIPDPDHPGQLIDCVEYTEHGSKNRPGGSHQLNLENMSSMYTVRAWRAISCTSTARYTVRAWRAISCTSTARSKLPLSAFERDVFYMKPRPRADIPPSAADPWYANVLLDIMCSIVSKNTSWLELILMEKQSQFASYCHQQDVRE